MVHRIDKMSFAHLKESDFILLKQILSDDKQRDRVLAELLAYLSFWSPDQWIDEEHLYFLGLDICLVCPSNFHDTVVDAVRNKIFGPVAKIFVAGFKRPTSKEVQVKSPPSKTELDKLLARLKTHFDSVVEADVKAIVHRYLVCIESDGYADDLVDALKKIGELLLKVQGPMARRAAKLTCDILQEGLKWKSDNYLWILWGRGLVKMGVFEAAELVYWEAIRRFPWDMYLRSMLIEVLECQHDKYNEAFNLARESFRIFPDSEAITNQLAMFLGQSQNASDISEAINILTANIKDNIFPKIGALASIMANAAGKNLLGDQDVELVVNRLLNEGQLLGTVSNNLINVHKAFDVAHWLWRKHVVLAPNNIFSKIQLAKTYILLGGKTNLSNASEILKKLNTVHLNDTIIRNFLAKVLTLTGVPEDIEEAKKILRNTMKITPEDVYAPCQFAELLLSSGDPSDRQEAINLLKKTREVNKRNKKFKKLLELIEKTPGGTSISTELMKEEPIVADEDQDFSIEKLDIDLNEAVPLDIIKLGTTRRLRFKMDNGSEEEKELVLTQVADMLNDAPLAYTRLIAVRYGIGEDQDQMTSFAFEFERALREHDKIALEGLSEKYTRFTALIIVAQAMFGDVQSAAKIADLMSVDDETLHPAVRALKRRMRPHLVLIRKGESPESVVNKGKSDILVALHDANESVLCEFALAA
ncbi:MAG: hypothetical protein H7839_02280 [Magnetococcus sp. YQC-5]